MPDDQPAEWLTNERAAREKLRSEHAGLVAAVSAILFECDPIGINFGQNTDEYDPEAGTIIPRLGVCTSQADVRRVTHEEFSRWFGGDTAGDELRYEDCAREIWAYWQTHQPM